MQPSDEQSLTLARRNLLVRASGEIEDAMDRLLDAANVIDDAIELAKKPEFGLGADVIREGRAVHVDVVNAVAFMRRWRRRFDKRVEELNITVGRF